jgi:hypothetical protein
MWVIAKPKSKTQFVKAEGLMDYGSLQKAMIYDTEALALADVTEKGEMVYEVEQVYKLKKV